MGFWNDGIRARSRSRSRSSSSSRSGSKPRQRKQSTASHSSSKHYASRPSFARSASSFLGLGGTGSVAGSARGSTRDRGRSSSSYTSARSRDGFVARVRRFLRQIYDYMRKHPLKVFVLVIMPLITGGVLTKLLATVGIRLPSNLERLMGSTMNRGVGQEERFYARGGARDFQGGSALPGMGGGVGDAVQGALSIAKMFL